MSSPAEIKINECQADIDELKSLYEKSTREKVKELLKADLDRLEADLSKLKRDEQIRLAKLNSATNGNTAAYTKKIDTYGWDQSEKFVKIYVTSLNDVSKVKESDVVSNFTENSLDVKINNLNNVNYNLMINNLLNKIDPQGSYTKVKTDSIIVFLKKLESGKHWSYVTGVEMKLKEKSSVPKYDEKVDPQEGLMSMMKKMYEEGDDEMKRTIAKAFTESREKSMRGGDDEMGGLGGMGGMGGMGGLGGMGGMGGLGGMGGMGGMDI